MTIVIIFFLIILLCLLFNKHMPIWFCHKLGWHLPPERIGFSGTSARGVCPRCGEHIHQDKDGHWF